jgi:hypothetical protein
MTAGTPDLRIYLYYQKLVLIEVKRKKGKLTPEQKKWHEEAAKRGFIVHTIYASTPHELLTEIRKIISENS